MLDVSGQDLQPTEVQVADGVKPKLPNDGVHRDISESLKIYIQNKINNKQQTSKEKKDRPSETGCEGS